MYFEGVTALEEAVAQLDSDISKLLVHIGGADSSVLKQELLSPSPTRRAVNAVLHCPCPRSPLSRRRQEHPESLRSLSAPNGVICKPLSPTGTMGGMLTVDSPSSRGSSRASSLDDLQEDEHEEEEEREYMEYHSNLNRHRRNSLSLPDLRDMSNSLVAASPISSLTSSTERLSLRKSSSRHGSMQNFQLPLLIEEDTDEDVDEQCCPLSQMENRSAFRLVRHRRNSVSLPDLRDNLQNTDDNNSVVNDSCTSDEEIHCSYLGNKRKSSSLLTHRKEQLNKLTHKRDSLETSMHQKNPLFTKDKSNNKQLLNLNFKT